MKKSLSLLFIMILWWLLPQMSQFSYLIPYGLVFILFFAFLWEKIERKMFCEKRIFLILLANLVIWFWLYFLLKPFDSELAFILFLVWITPTATAAPWVISLLKGKTSFVIASVLVSNVFMAFAWPFFFRYTWYGDISVLPVLVTTLQVIIIPLLIAQGIQKFFPFGKFFLLSRFEFLSFYVWLWVIFLAISRASDFIIVQSDFSVWYIMEIFIWVVIVCAINFSVWKCIWGKQFCLESAQSLGQKNTIFSTWVALNFFSPVVALGPIFYILCHNLYNVYLFYVRKNKLD
jgi:BASS family bile acid:Na+ symporter